MDAIAAASDPATTRARGAWMMRAAYPILWIWLIGCGIAALNAPDALPVVAAIKGAAIFLFLFALELIYPLERRWGITWNYFVRRDAVLAGFNIATTMLLSYGLLLLAIGTAGSRHGVMSGQPLWVQVVVGLLVFEMLQYTVHAPEKLRDRAVAQVHRYGSTRSPPLT